MRPVVLSAVTLLLASAAAGADVRSLDAGLRHRRTLAPGDVHEYAIGVAANEVTRLTLTQHGLDVVADVLDDRGTTIDRVDSERRRDVAEAVDIFSAQGGAFVVRITAAEGVAEPGDYTIQLTARRPATAADAAIAQAHSIRASAVQLESAGAFPDARAAFERALALVEPLRPADDLFVATLRFELAGNALERHDDGLARTLYDSAAASFERLGGADQPSAAMARSRIALLLERGGEARKAEAAARASLASLERTLGPQHPWVARALVTLANIRADAGDDQEAEAIDRRVLDILERSRLTGSILDATVLNNLGEILRQRRDYAGAATLFERSLAIGERLRGPDSYFVSTALVNLGIVARERKDYPAAVQAYTRALAIRERVVGSEHPDIAQLLNNLGNIYRATGNDTRALELYARALCIWEDSMGSYGRGTLLTVGNIARAYAARGDLAQALAFQRRADTILEAQIELNLAAGSERQKLAFVRSVAERTDRTISLHLQQARSNPDAAALAALVILQRKGRAQDAMTDAFAAVRMRATSHERALIDRLQETYAKIARLALAGDSTPRGDLRARLAELERQKEALESTLSDQSAGFRSGMPQVTLEAVQARIPDGAALLEFAVFRPFNPAAERNDEAYGAPRYAVYVLRRHEPPSAFDLGAASDVDAAVGRLLGALRDPSRADIKVRARDVEQRILQPVLATLGDVTRLIVSPDGDLNLVPFDALADARGRYLIERYSTSYVTSGRDLLRVSAAASAAAGAPVIVANPDFSTPVPKTTIAHTPVSRGDAAWPYFAPLHATAVEGLALKRLFPRASLLTGDAATKMAVQQVQHPAILHIASHGFFLPAARGSAAAANQPLLRSGLALAGANRDHAGSVLTALEAAALDLWGTQLVTLSACDTGVGDVRSGEGVYGFRRAFVLAGAEALVMSLWPVRDDEARETMVGFYTGLREGAERSEALRQAKLKILRRPSTRHPFYWAAFIQSGAFSPLAG